MLSLRGETTEITSSDRMAAILAALIVPDCERDAFRFLRFPRARRGIPRLQFRRPLRRNRDAGRRRPGLARGVAAVFGRGVVRRAVFVQC